MAGLGVVRSTTAVALAMTPGRFDEVEDEKEEDDDEEEDDKPGQKGDEERDDATEESNVKVTAEVVVDALMTGAGA